MKNAPLIILKATVGGLLPAALLLYIALAVGGESGLRDGLEILRCLPTPDPQTCIQQALKDNRRPTHEWHF